MEDLDGLIMDTLKKLDCSFCSDIDALGLMGQQDIVEAIVKLLWACKPENKERIQSASLPHAMTIKYKAATTIANAIKELGVREEVGYQTLLYPNIYEIRQIFISLIEKLPKQAIQADEHKSPLEQLKSRIGVQIQEDIKRPRYPCYCRFLTRASQPNKWNLKAHHSEMFNFSTANSSDFRRRICSALEGSPANLDFSLDQLTFKQQMSGGVPKRSKPPTMPKPCLPPKPKPRTVKTDEEKTPEDENNIIAETNLQQLRKKDHELRLELEAHGEQLGGIHSQLHSMEADLELRQLEWKTKDEKLLQIIRDPETQFPHLQSFIDNAPDRRQLLENTLADWKTERLPELERLRQAAGLHLTQSQREEAQKMSEKLKRAISNQTHALHKLQKQANKVVETDMDNSERTKFLARIMYLVKSVNAQKEEIERSFLASTSLEKEHNQLSGNLSRTFMAVNTWLNANADSDPIVRKAHSSLVRMHEQCDSICQLINSMFILNQQADEFQDMIELLLQQQTDNALDQILEDLSRVREENNEIKQRLEASR
ncbi:Coiled-coil domain-containing protein 22-like protein [Aphelenchoides bicaudatus]|nr:Coiled-coil domain-containing protein 22-like protein [Aphelenchoides bicaudatus]